MNYKLEFSLKDIKIIFFALIIVEVIFTIVYLSNYFLQPPFKIITKFFDLDREANIPTWFSSIQLFVIGIIFSIEARKPANLQFPTPLFLLIVSIGFIFLSVDESASIHESITDYFKHLSWLPRFKGNHGVWISIYISIIIIFFLASYGQFKILWNNYKHNSLIMISGVFLFLLGAVFLEIVSYQFLRENNSSLLYHIEVASEEFLEMFGGSLILFGAVNLSLSRSLRN